MHTKRESRNTMHDTNYETLNKKQYNTYEGIRNTYGLRSNDEERRANNEYRNNAQDP